MKNISYKKLLPIRLILVAVLFTVLISSCQDENESGSRPVISEVRNYAGAPNDTVVHTINTGQWLVLIGENLGTVSQVYFNGVPASVNRAYLTDETVVVQVPSIPFQSVPPDQRNQITVVNENGPSVYEMSIVGPPQVLAIRNYAAAPNDTLVDYIVPGQQLNLIGFNLSGATQIEFQGIATDLESVIYTDSSAVVTVPSDLSGGDVSKANRIHYTTRLGTTVVPMRIIGPPLINHISWENPQEGSTVYLKGFNFLNIQSLYFAGAEVTSYTAPSDSVIELTVPPLAESGPVEITTKSGTYTTIFNVNNGGNEVLCNFDDVSPVGWGGWGATVWDSSTEFPGNKGKYGVLQNGVVNPWDWGAWGGGRIIILDPVKWLPKASETDPLDSWAVKFELNVPQGWNGNSLFVSSEHNDYRITWEPWKDATGRTFAFTTNGWRTITLPLSLFRKGWGGTASPANLVDLLGNTESNGFAIQTMNISSASSATGLKAAVDNIRIVKIKN
jgi:hypothetical protein